ncbi:hypothetical protein [Erwinia sp. JH02]|uniref:hypothetical protein n=1 Tax=Erwinia sp. JH02 TaxID=2733394 RepID=UPI0014894AF5|nr:hypothetical protein [Erwinia sp. JH02]NNS05734.1 hypothetical protein [Erwinia sp. JH02]
MKILIAGLFFLSFTSYAQSHLGTWGTTCDDEGFSIQLSKIPSPLIVNDNQIIISIHSKEISANQVAVYFDKPLDLGTGGMNLAWDSFSTTKSVAEMTIKGSSGLFRWYGFFDKSKKKYVWVDGPDFVQDHTKNGLIKLKRCD